MAIPAVIPSNSPASSLWILTYYINDTVGQKSRSERYCLGVAQAYPRNLDGVAPANAVGEPTDNANLILSFRQALLGASGSIVWARLSTTGRAADGRRLLTTGPLGPIARTGESPIGPLNMGGDAAEFRFENAQRVHGNRAFAMIRDSDVTNSTFQFTVPEITPAYVIPASPGPTDGLSTWKNWIAVVLNYTFRHHQVFRNGPFLIDSWTTASFLRSRTVSLGPLFGQRPHTRRRERVG